MGNEVVDNLNNGVLERWGVGKEEGMWIKLWTGIIKFYR